MTDVDPPQPLISAHDLLLVDLDGVVMLGDQPIPGAAAALQTARDAGVRLAFVTNNASKTARQVAAALEQLGVHATPGEVLTSSMVAADVLAARLSPGDPVLVVGGPGLTEPIRESGLTPVAEAEQNPRAVVQGWSPDICWSDLAEAAVALRSGVPWVATNLDRTLPSPRGPLPGNGSLVAALSTATGRAPESVGKPEPALFEVAVRRAMAARPLMVGDRLDTDIAGANGAGIPTLLVLTGVSSPHDLLAAGPEQRPDFIGSNLGAVHEPHPQVRVVGDVATCRASSVTATGDVTPGSDALDGLRAAAALAWSGRLPPDSYDAVLAVLGYR